MLQALGFFMDFRPLHAEDLVQHALDQVMANRQPPRDLPALTGQVDATFGGDRHQPIAF